MGNRNSTRFQGDPHNLVPAQRVFVEEFVRTWNGRGAVKKAYPNIPTDNTKHLDQRFVNLSTSPKVKAAIEARAKEILDRLGVTSEMVIREISAVAFANVAHFVTFDADGVTLRSLEDILDDPNSRKFIPAISSIKSTQGKFGTNVELKMHDKLAALGRLTQMLELVNSSPTDHADDNSIYANASKEVLGKLSRLATALGTGEPALPTNTGGTSESEQQLAVLGEGQPTTTES
jgi:hypothetical protein